MSNAIRYDSLLVQHLARELDERLRGRSAGALRLDPANRRASLELDDGALLLDLHPTRGWILEAAVPSAPDIRRLHRSARIGRVHAPPDERLLRIDLEGSTSENRPIRSLIVELMTNQANVLALDKHRRIVALLWPRTAGGRELRAGRIYEMPPGAPRDGVDAPVVVERWSTGAGAGAGAGAGVAWVSPLNAAALGSYDDYLRIVWGEARPSVIRRADGALQPYPQPIGSDARRVPSLLEGMRECAGAAPPVESASAAADPEAIDRVRREITRIAARIDRMEAQRRRALPQAATLRSRADLLLARLHEVPRGAGRVTLVDFEGGAVELDLDPAHSAADNARRMYDAARKRERAAERIPALVAEARRRIARLEALVARAERGEADAAEIDATLPRETTLDAKGEESPLPFRRYTTSGGLEVRVGRSSRANDELTFHHSSPDDIWLHARDVAGAHVILRWSRGDANPPQRDLAEAAVLAALYSRARTSGTVPVDWTRRKYVRKPRKAPPGSVLPERVKTVFVEPDEAVEARMR
ncbi:MAG TPA: NFACT RNA binding domain-containing protein [Longimicrobiales bacterium]|nr:NFACT RNA binding domain-containing protein [Longimicrobiales bacterium]